MTLQDLPPALKYNAVQCNLDANRHTSSRVLLKYKKGMWQYLFCYAVAAVQELESVLDRAVSQLSGAGSVQVPEEVFWFATQVNIPLFE